MTETMNLEDTQGLSSFGYWILEETIKGWFGNLGHIKAPDGNGFRILCCHKFSDMTKDAQIKVMQDFYKGETKIMITCHCSDSGNS